MSLWRAQTLILRSFDYEYILFLVVDLGTPTSRAKSMAAILAPLDLDFERLVNLCIILALTANYRVSSHRMVPTIVQGYPSLSILHRDTKAK